MIERRKESRVRVELRVEISGMDAACETFSQTVKASNISWSGALLRDVTAVLRCGDPLEIQYGERQGQFRIIWVLDRGARDGLEVAVHRMPSSPCPWESVLDLQQKPTIGERAAGDREEAVLPK